MLRLIDIAKRYGDRTVLAGVSLDLAPGEYVAIMGESGAGKSTLLNVIAGLETADGGRVELEGRDVTRLPDEQAARLRREKFGFVFQAFHVLPHLTAAQNVALPLLLRSVGSAERRRRVQEALSSVGLAERARSMPRELSGGELQRVAIARALIHHPRLVLADEPTGNLDPENARRVLDLLHAEIARHNAAAIVVTHSEAVAARCDRRYRLGTRGLEVLP